MSWDWRKILEVLILGQFVIEKVISSLSTPMSMILKTWILITDKHPSQIGDWLVGNEVI